MLLHHSSRPLPRWIAPILGGVLGGVLLMPIAPKVLDSPNPPIQTAQLRPARESLRDDSFSDTNRNVAAFAIVALGAGIIGWSWKSKQTAPATSPNSSRWFGTGQSRSQRELVRLLHNDHQAAQRLVQQVQAKHPERSLDWCVEKVIYDLQRDRH